MKVIPTTPTWLTLEDYYAIFKPSREPTEDLYLIFEKEFAQYLGRKHAVLTSSGTAGIYLALKAFGFPPGTEVITPAFTCIRVPNAIVACGLVPRFVDVDDSANMDINAVEGVLNPRTRFLLLTHMYGNPANIDPLSSLANLHNLIVIEDCCLTLDSTYEGRLCGTFGHISIFSLNRSKTISAFGGGVVVTDDDEMAEKIRLLREQESQPINKKEKYRLMTSIVTNNFIFHPWVFGNIGKRVGRTPIGHQLSRPPDLVRIAPVRLKTLADFQLRLGLCQSRRIKWFSRQRRIIADKYNQGITEINLGFIKKVPGASPCWSHYSLILNSNQTRPDVSRNLVQLGIQSGELFNYVCPLTPAYQALQQTCFPKALHLARKLINLPFHPYLSEAEQAKVISAVQTVFKI